MQQLAERCFSKMYRENSKYKTRWNRFETNLECTETQTPSKRQCLITFMADKELGYLWNYLTNLVHEKADLFVACVLVMRVILWNILEEDKNS